MAKRVGVILSGNGVFDGAEIHESVLALLALDRAGAKVRIFAPDTPQARVVDHRTQQPVQETRNVLTESARIARGVIEDVKAARAEDLDAVILPGGFGAATNLCTFAVDGPGCSINEDVSRLLGAMHDAGKPIGAICIAPAVVARALGAKAPVRLTIGTDAGTAANLEKLGIRHVAHPVDEIEVDREHKVVTTPAYMLATRISEVATGVERLVQAVLGLA